MSEENKKMLLFLNSSNPWHRVIRRGFIMGFFAFVAGVLKMILDDVGLYIPLDWQWLLIPAITALLAAIDKKTRIK